jgi:RNA polymerase sigma-70 factor (ECF subfamily)
MQPEETELIKKAQHGDRASFEELIYKYDRGVLSLAYSYANDQEDAKDIYQDVFLRVFKGLKKFEFRSEFSTWLYRITVNVALTHKTKKGKYSYASLDEEISGADGETKLAYETVADDSSSDERAISSDISGNIKRAIEKLSPQQKLVFTLKHFEEYKINEIAEMMNISTGTVKNYLFNATLKMREYLKEFDV